MALKNREGALLRSPEFDGFGVSSYYNTSLTRTLKNYFCFVGVVIKLTANFAVAFILFGQFK